MYKLIYYWIIIISLISIYTVCEKSPVFEETYFGRIDFTVTGHDSGTFMVPAEYSWDNKNEHYILGGENDDVVLSIGFLTGPADIPNFPNMQNSWGEISGIGESYSSKDSTGSFTINSFNTQNGYINGSLSFSAKCSHQPPHVIDVSGNFSGVPREIE